jgi:predicted Fe-Mo cluster-binding NifX family protein
MEKIAIITDDGKRISRHFGRATHYLVVSIEDGRETGRELRAKPGHQHFVGQQGHQEDHAHGEGQRHGFDPESQNRHFQMASVIQDCSVLICGGMGMGAYEGMKSANIRPVVTDLWDVDQALQAYLAGTLQDRTDLLH